MRREIVEELAGWFPEPLSRVFLLTTGAEAVECCLKIACTAGRAIAADKRVIVSFENAFHGRTMGAQMAGGSPALKSWLGGFGADRFVQVPFPDGFRQRDTSFEVFERTLRECGVAPAEVCGVISETYQGCNATLMPPEYAQALREWCTQHQAALILDEVQAGFGRTGARMGFEHLGVVPDLVACGKGISGGMPMSAVVGKEDLMGLYGPGEMTSTHSANPICCAAALANLQAIREEGLVENARRLDPVLRAGLERIAQAGRGAVGHWDAVGLVGALQFTRPDETTPWPEAAWALVRGAVYRGVLLFAPVGVGGGAVKINPPLMIEEAMLREGLEVLAEVAAEMMEARSS